MKINEWHTNCEIENIETCRDDWGFSLNVRAIIIPLKYWKPVNTLSVTDKN